MIYKTEKDIDHLKKWCETNEIIKKFNYYYNYCHIENDNIIICYSQYEFNISFHFRLCFTKNSLLKFKYIYRWYHTYHIYYYQIILLSDVLSEIRINKINSLLQE